MNQEYKNRVRRHLDAGGDPKYVNVKRKAQARHENEAKSKALENKKEGKKKTKEKVYYPGREKRFMKSIGNPKSDKTGLHF